MTITLEVQPESATQLQTLAATQGLPAEEYAQALFQKALQREQNAATLAALEAFMEDDAEEQRETWEALQKGLAESRLATRRAVS